MKQLHKEEFNKHNNKHNKKHKHILLILLAVLLAEHQYRQRQTKEQALKEADDAKKRANASKNQKIILHIKMSDHQIIDQRQNREQEVHVNKLSPIPPFPTSEPSGSRDNPESEHEPKGNPGRPSNKPPTERTAS